ncbi:MAG TPA: hypothetical protein PKC21_06115 [Oligoflexia bacterium]|nr:hypothetical protein [Oligoflexia bacterium]HMR24910.1 hypothetical protein [Oligoflexia bacterium]
MNKQHAQTILNEQEKLLSAIAFEELKHRFLNLSETKTIQGSDGVNYQIQIEGFWDDSSKKRLRIVIAIDDGGLRAFSPMTTDILVSP